MQKYFILILFLFLASCSRSQTYLGRFTTPQIGVLISDNFSGTSLSGNWTKFGSETATVNNSIRLVGATSTKDLTQVLNYTGYGKSTLRNYVVTAKFKLNSTAGGVSIGVESKRNAGIGSQVASTYGAIDFTGSLQVLGAANDRSIYTTAATSSTGIPAINTSDNYELSLAIYENDAVVTFKNLTASTQKQVTFTYDFVTPYGGGMHRPNIFNYSFGILKTADVTFSSITVTSSELNHPNIVFIGNSETTGYYSGSTTNAFAYKLRSYTSKTIQIMAGGGMTTQDALDNEYEIIERAPTYAFIMMGTNDGNTADAKDRIVMLFNDLTAAGIICYVLPNPNGGDPATSGTYNNSLSVAFGSSFKDIWSGVNGMGSFSNPADIIDCCHFTNAGEQKIADKIHSILPLIFEL